MCVCVCVNAYSIKSNKGLFLRVWEEIRSQEGNIVWDFRSFEGEREQRV